MEFNDLLTQEAHEEGAELEIYNPETGKKTGFFITVMGADSLAFQKEQKKLRNKAILAYSKDKEPDYEEEIKDEIRHLANITLDWRGIESNGKPKPFTKEHCIELYTKSPGVRQQVDRFVSDRANFTKG